MLPGTDDYNGAAVALHRLEDTYNLKPRDIRSGSLSKKYPSRELTGKIFI
jgi:prolyl 4-hydroxylase